MWALVYCLASLVLHCLQLSSGVPPSVLFSLLALLGFSTFWPFYTTTTVCVSLHVCTFPLFPPVLTWEKSNDIKRRKLSILFQHTRSQSRKNPTHLLMKRKSPVWFLRLAPTVYKARPLPVKRKIDLSLSYEIDDGLGFPIPYTTGIIKSEIFKTRKRLR